jgi:hypothetical protein
MWSSCADPGRECPGACWPRAKQDNLSRLWLDAAELEEAGDHHGRARVSRKLAEDHRSRFKNITQKTLLERLRRRHPKNVNFPQPTTCDAYVKIKPKKKARQKRKEKKLHSSKARRTTSHHR